MNIFKLWPASAKRGSVTIMTGLVALPLVAFAGIAIDTSRLWLVQSRLQESLDAAILAAARGQALHGSTADGVSLFWANFLQSSTAGATGYLGATAATPVVTQPADSTIKMTVSATLPMSILSVIGFTNVTVSASAQAVSYATGLELSMVLDNTGSMAGWPIQSVITSATELVNIVYGSGTQDTQPNLWVSVVPFSAEVNIGSNHISWLVGGGVVASRWAPAGWKGCVMARYQNGNDFTDATPAAAPFNPFAYASTLGQYSVGSVPIAGDNDWAPNNITEQNQSTLPANTAVGPNLGCTAQSILLETASRTTVLTAIAQSQATYRGGTFINLGLQAGWWTISPNWQGLWGTSTLPLAYNTPYMKKVIVLMTDGNNLWNDWNLGAPGAGPSPWVSDGDTDYSAYGRLRQNLMNLSNNTAANATTNINTRMSAMCSIIKQQGITIYAILFNHDGNISSATQTLFQNCASSPSDYFLTPTDAALQAAFSQIGAQLSNLRLSQ